MLKTDLVLSLLDQYARRWFLGGRRQKENMSVFGLVLISTLSELWCGYLCFFLQHKTCQNADLQYEECFKKVSCSPWAIICFSFAYCCIGCLCQCGKWHWWQKWGCRLLSDWNLLLFPLSLQDVCSPINPSYCCNFFSPFPTWQLLSQAHPSSFCLVSTLFFPPEESLKIPIHSLVGYCNSFLF